MRQLDHFMLQLRTGPRGRKDMPRVCFNDTVCYELENVEGTTASGDVLTASYSPHKAVHKFVLEGPENGYWDIEDAEVTFSVRHREPYTVRLGPMTLNAQSDLNLWYESPEDTFDV